MNTTTEVTLTAIIVVAGEWSKTGKWPTVKYVVGTGVYLLFLSALSESQPKLASQFGALVLITVILVYFQDIAKKLGFAK